MALNTYTQVRQAEDVQDEIYMISPADSPIASLSKTVRATGKLHEWSEDRLNSSGANRAVEGADAGSDTSQAITALNNYCQILTKVAKITNTMEVVDKYGRDSEMAYQLEMRYAELSKDIELAISGQPGGAFQTATAGNASTARQMAALQTQHAGGPNVATLRLDATSDDTLAKLETRLLDAHQGAHAQGGNPDTLVVTPPVSRYVASFAAASGRNRELRDTRTIVNTVDLYVSPFGELNVVQSRELADYEMLGLDFNHTATAVLRPTQDFPLAFTGDSIGREIVTEMTFCLLNRDSAFRVHSISNSL